MKVLVVIVIMTLVAISSVAAAPSPPPKMRPYVGIGILLLPITVSDPVILYEEPGLSRVGELNRAKIPPLEWIIGPSPVVQPLIVMARRGTWLQVAYDDAGREAWLNPSRQMTFQVWELFFKGHVSRLLPGLQKKYYQVFQEPGISPLAVLTVKQPFKVLQFEGDWAIVLIEQNALGWLRWRDDDGRLLIGIVTEQQVRLP